MNLLKNIISFEGNVPLPGKWISQIAILIGIMILGRFLFKEKNKRSDLFWSGTIIITGITVLRLLWVI